MLSLFVSLLQAFFVKLKLNLPYIAVGQAKIRGVTPNLLNKTHINNCISIPVTVVIFRYSVTLMKTYYQRHVT